MMVYSAVPNRSVGLGKTLTTTRRYNFTHAASFNIPNQKESVTSCGTNKSYIMSYATAVWPNLYQIGSAQR